MKQRRAEFYAASETQPTLYRRGCLSRGFESLCLEHISVSPSAAGNFSEFPRLLRAKGAPHSRSNLSSWARCFEKLPGRRPLPILLASNLTALAPYGRLSKSWSLFGYPKNRDCLIMGTQRKTIPTTCHVSTRKMVVEHNKIIFLMSNTIPQREGIILP